MCGLDFFCGNNKSVGINSLMKDPNGVSCA